MKLPNKAQTVVYKMLEDDSVRCAHCGHAFDYAHIPEAQMGVVRCPECKTKIDQTGAVLETMDPDDPEAFVKAQPGFDYRSTQFMGTQVFMRGAGYGETEDEWPWPIGNIVQGPDDRWYVIGIHRVPPEKLGQYGFGFGEGVKTFPDQEQAAMALWQVYRTLPEHPLHKLRRRREMRESLSDKEIMRYLSGVKPRPGLKRYSTAQLQRFLRLRRRADRRRPPEPPGEPHRIG